jgi:hypothetical protein
MRPRRYRVLRPLLVAGRIAGVNEVVRMTECAALEWVESGHLREIVNGEAAPATGQWCEPMQR